MIVKACTKCKGIKPLNEFYTHPRTKDRRQSRCKKCCLRIPMHLLSPEEQIIRIAYRLKETLKHKDRINKYMKEYNKKTIGQRYKNHIRRNYGITMEDYNRMLDSQGGTCLICGKPNKNGHRLCVDHDHTTNKTRGLLCIVCNRNLGWYEKYKDVINKYLSCGI